MVSSLLSVLLMGMLPVWNAPETVRAMPSLVSVAAPSPLAATVAGIGTPGLYGLSASGMVVVDLESGQRLYGKNDLQRRSIGSLTKLMTALVITEHHALTETVTIPETVRSVEGNRVYLAPGERYSVGDLLTALLVASANDAAYALAEFHAGSSAAFATEMNERARTLGLRRTSFANPAGFDDPDQWSTPQDIAWLMMFVLRRPELREKLSSSSAVIKSAGGRSIALQHTHLLLHTPGPVIAGKTGTTDGAAECLASLVVEGGREYLVILLGSHRRYVDMQALLRMLGDAVSGTTSPSPFSDTSPSPSRLEGALPSRPGTPLA